MNFNIYKKLTTSLCTIFLFLGIICGSEAKNSSLSQNNVKTSVTKTFIVTGGCGFIGSHLVDELISAGHKVVIIDNMSTGKLKNLNKKALLIKGSILDQASLVKAFSNNPDGVFHLAAVASVPKCNENWLVSHQTNVSGIIAIFEHAAKRKIPVVYASSAAVYGDQKGQVCKESNIARPKTAYGVDKLGCELHAQVAYDIHKTPSVGLRFFNVYGPRQDSSPYSGVIAIFAKRLLAEKPITIFGDGKQVRDFIYVKDIVKAAVLSMDSLLHKTITSADQGARIYNVASGETISIIELVQNLEIACKTKANIKFMEQRAGDINISIASVEKIKQDLGYEASTSLQKGLTNLIAYLKA